MIKKRTNKAQPAHQRATKKTKPSEHGEADEENQATTTLNNSGDGDDENTIHTAATTTTTHENNIDNTSPHSKTRLDEDEDNTGVLSTAEKIKERKSKLNQENSLLSSSTKQQTKSILPIHETIIKANREEKQDESYLDRITSTNVNEFDELDSEKKKKDVGPTKVSKHVRVTSRMDYQPDICKDYYETGFCGYGDNCKFAHVREKYVNSIEHTKAWEKEQQKKVEDARTQKDSSQQLPHACFICRQPFKDPIVTLCGHYFCSKCAIDRYNGGKEPHCACCGQNTKGVFNTAHKIIAANKKGASHKK
ncbi:hypothetical protein C9374_002594 [Naegleria lovaniensis]|uniref:Pre-mRNA-splicing factor CWC24 n=1 Tax=Naegleria lovaniensis TaxID=51637 RepID=A0AA88GTT2_NAELO|nr:uncharacterized protein C9374_002594 [Naegleria lovaniensis]KAG2386148.1 hypothetical protein C9374_002594 [Naegleria lovaniensis]